ncbi:hypothetical protein [Roseiconus lacunae]|uniref:Uncharacterized protein n=1 Tax=Roseiconus lacunae TaxID=2605694 RepID=A0ABT7PS39_9BACT|nr:hypothetical protein [Roseiconus lacunae]MDM4019307.1 hypothetical protein [Roseiconus lacunae]
MPSLVGDIVAFDRLEGLDFSVNQALANDQSTALNKVSRLLPKIVAVFFQFSRLAEQARNIR